MSNKRLRLKCDKECVKDECINEHVGLAMSIKIKECYASCH